MRNAIDIGNGFVVTTDNSGGIGEKPHDLVTSPDQVTAYFAARVALFEQWAAHADPVSVLIHNFTGRNSWESYVKGVEEVFQEANLELPQITGSTETNMELMQSVVAVTMIGKQRIVEEAGKLEWYVYGTPLVGNEVLERRDDIASLRLIKEAMEKGIVAQLWQVGSGGVLSEYRKLKGDMGITIQADVDLLASAGPSTAVLIGIPVNEIEQAQRHFQGPLHKITIQTSS